MIRRDNINDLVSRLLFLLVHGNWSFPSPAQSLLHCLVLQAQAFAPWCPIRVVLKLLPVDLYSLVELLNLLRRGCLGAESLIKTCGHLEYAVLLLSQTFTQVGVLQVFQVHDLLCHLFVVIH